MNKIQIFIGVIIIVVLGYFGYNSYQNIEESNSKYRNNSQKNEEANSKYRNNSQKNENNEPLSIEIHEMYGDSNRNENSSTGKPIFRFVSTSNDLENETDILQTNNERTYHTFNFNENTISMKTRTADDQWITHTFKIKKSSIKESLSGLQGMEFDIDNPRCRQIWVSSLGNIGYEFYNGQTLVFYDVKEVSN